MTFWLGALEERLWEICNLRSWAAFQMFLWGRVESEGNAESRVCGEGEQGGKEGESEVDKL